MKQLARMTHTRTEEIDRTMARETYMQTYNHKQRERHTYKYTATHTQRDIHTDIQTQIQRERHLGLGLEVVGKENIYTHRRNVAMEMVGETSIQTYIHTQIYI